MSRLIAFIMVLIFFMSSCTGHGSFSLTIEHYAGGPGVAIIYELNQKGLEINTNCDLEDCKLKTLYERTFTQNESDSIYNFINSLQLDTLKSSYKSEGILDGLYTAISFKKGFLESYSSTFDNYNTPTTSRLFRYVDGLIPERKYRFYSWGENN